MVDARPRLADDKDLAPAHFALRKAARHVLGAVYLRGIGKAQSRVQRKRYIVGGALDVYVARRPRRLSKS
jgi:hypothetical protein